MSDHAPGNVGLAGIGRTGAMGHADKQPGIGNRMPNYSSAIRILLLINLIAAGAVVCFPTAQAAPVIGSFATTDISAGSFQYDSSTPFSHYDGDSAIYAPVSGASVTFTYQGITSTFEVSEILVDPGIPDGHLGYRDELTLDFGPFDQLSFWHTPADSLPSYKLVDLNPSVFTAGFFNFSDFIGGNIVAIDQPLELETAIPEPSAFSLLIVSMLALIAIKLMDITRVFRYKRGLPSAHSDTA
jgi:hypothetical protein